MEEIEIPECLLPINSSSIAQNDTTDDSSSLLVDVRSVSQHCHDAQELVVQPLSLDDWTLLSQHASRLEHGGLLRQVSVVYANQVLSLLVARDLVRVRVMPWENATKTETALPQTQRNPRADSRRPRYLRLVANT